MHPLRWNASKALVLVGAHSGWETMGLSWLSQGNPSPAPYCDHSSGPLIQTQTLWSAERVSGCLCSIPPPRRCQSCRPELLRLAWLCLSSLTSQSCSFGLKRSKNLGDCSKNFREFSRAAGFTDSETIQQVMLSHKWQQEWLLVSKILINGHFFNLNLCLSVGLYLAASAEFSCQGVSEFITTSS